MSRLELIKEAAKKAKKRQQTAAANKRKRDKLRSDPQVWREYRDYWNARRQRVGAEEWARIKADPERHERVKAVRRARIAWRMENDPAFVARKKAEQAKHLALRKSRREADRRSSDLHDWPQMNASQAAPDQRF